MAAVLEIVLKGRDNLSGPLGKAQVSLGWMVKTGAAAALGFGGMEMAMMGAKNVIVNSIGAAAAYEHQMAQIRALTGATKEDTDFLKGSIREMQETLPKSSAELGAGAYFILSAEEAATGLRGVMVQLLKPSEEAKELLAGVGMSMQEIRDQVREKGLLS